MLLNAGEPSGPFEIEAFLKNMFHDEYILGIKGNLARRVIGSFVANKRLFHIQESYKRINGKSPIASIIFSLCKKLNQKRQDVFFTYAMRYTPPQALMVIEELRQRRINEVLLLSLYPQYSVAITLSLLRDLRRAFEELVFDPTIKEIQRFYHHSLFLKCIHSQIQKTLRDRNYKDYVLILSAYGLPQKLTDESDSYQKECEDHVKILKKYFLHEGVEFEDIVLAYQVKIGVSKGAKPLVDDIVKRMKGKKLLIYPLTSVVDSFDTHYGLDIALREIAQKNGVEDFLLCSCPNDSDELVELILDLVKENGI